MSASASIAPRDYPRRVLLAVVGQTPQILTETVYALAVAAQADDSFVPTEVQVVTTEVGARGLRERLLAGPESVWWRLLAYYRLGPIEFDESSIHVVRHPDGQRLHDIRSAADNACVADAITERVRDLTSDPDCALHVSLAGGRKTMGYYAGYALSLFGRDQDRLSHVLVDATYEALADFHYPTPEPCMLAGRHGEAALDASQARVELAQIPFVRLRTLLPPAVLAAPSGFATVVAAARMPPAPPSLRLEVERHEVVADGQVIQLTPTQFALLAALAQRAVAGKPPLPAPLRDGHDPEWAQEVLADLRAAVGVMNVDSAVASSLIRDCSGNKISPHLSRLRKMLRDRLAPGRVALYFDEGGTHRHKRYRVPLAPEAIVIVRPRGSCKLAGAPWRARVTDTLPDAT
ncbi:MAG: TIGR02584 family CRISPR-associated protein [Rubrivivax sp.]|nr:TIGR02584 family CRISPR-associated protein [Rubrivivax sp.]